MSLEPHPGEQPSPTPPARLNLQAAYFMKAVLARTNFENADLSDALMDRAVIVEANLKGAILQVGSPWVPPWMLLLPLRAGALCIYEDSRTRW